MKTLVIIALIIVLGIILFFILLGMASLEVMMMLKEDNTDNENEITE